MIEKEISEYSGEEIYHEIESIRASKLHGIISYEDAQIAIAPLVEEINRRGKLISKKYKKRHNPISVGYVLR